MPGTEGNNLFSRIGLGVSIILLAAAVLGLFQMKEDISTGRNDVTKVLGEMSGQISLYSVQLANTERSFQSSLAAHVSMEAHKEAGSRIRLLELKLERLESKLSIAQSRIEALKSGTTR